MRKVIKIGAVEIPLDSYVISGTAVLGTKESGKTYTSKSIAEQLLDYEIPIVAFDAIGVWRYLKVASEREGGKAFKVVVAGGKEPDLPLTPGNAAQIVRAAIHENIPLIIDLYDMNLSKSDWRKIVQTCFRTLLFENVGLRHIFLEEAPEYAPQKVIDGETYAEVEKLVRMGGNVSLGITLLSQRPQEVNKAVLDLCENVILMRQRGARSIDNLEKWTEKLSPSVSKRIAHEMPNMKAGEAWVFTSDAELPTRTRAGLLQSYHPDRRKPDIRAMTTVVADTGEFVTRLTGELVDVIAQQKANDPKALKARVAELEKKLAEHKPIDVEALSDATERLRAAEYQLGRAAGYLEGQSFQRRHILDLFHGTIQDIDGETLQALPQVAFPDSSEWTSLEKRWQQGFDHRPDWSKAQITNDKTIENLVAPEPKLSPSARKVVDVIHRSYPVGLTFAAAARRAGISNKSSAYSKYCKEVLNCSEVTVGDGPGGRIRSLAQFSHTAAVTTIDGIETWIAKLPPSYGKMLQAIADNSPSGLDKEGIASESGVSETSSGLGAGIKELLSLELIIKEGDVYSLAEGL